jgi:hypothetical protein
MPPARTTVRPRVFVSSTVKDFADLRQAIKYWLEEMDYEVQLSEFNDFERRPDDGTFEACFRGVSEADFYVLLIGDRCGQYYDQAGRISVTQQEYRTAYESWRSTNQPKLLLFVRRETLLRLRLTTSSDGETEFVRSFVREVRREDESQAAASSDSAFPGSNWLTDFDNFRELTDTLRVLLDAHGPLARTAIIEDLRQELRRNLRTMMWSVRGRPTYRYVAAVSVREHIEISQEDIDGFTRLSNEDIKRLVMYIPTPAHSVVSGAIEHSIHSGALFDFSATTNSFVPSPLLAALYELREELAVYQTRYSAFTADYEMVHRLWSVVRNTGASADAPTLNMISLLGLIDCEQNVVRITLAILRYLYRHTDTIDFQRRPTSPIAGEDQRIEESLVSDSDLDAALIRDSLFLTMGTVDMTQEQSAAVQEGEERIESLLGQENYSSYKARFQELFLQEVPDTADAIREMTRRVLDELNLVPPTAQRSSDESARTEEQ